MMQAGSAGKSGSPCGDGHREVERLVLANLDHMEAAAEVVDRITEQLDTAVRNLIDGFLAETGWEGHYRALDDFWVAPPSWCQLPVLGDVQVVAFAIALSGASDGQADQFMLSSLTGFGRQRAMLLWRREVAGSGLKFGKYLAKQREMVRQLAALGFERNGHLGGSFHLPIRIDADLLTSEDVGDVAAAAAPIVAALRQAHAAAHLFEPLVSWNRDALGD